MHLTIQPCETQDKECKRVVPGSGMGRAGVEQKPTGTSEEWGITSVLEVLRALPGGKKVTGVVPCLLYKK